MSYQNIGKNIARLRKEKNITQEELGEAVGVSGQAVSKWESGGSPDIEMLESVADYFDISIDFLFDRKINDYSDLETELINNITTAQEKSEKLSKCFDYCFAIHKSISGDSKERRMPEIIEELKKDNFLRRKSQARISDGSSLKGISMMGMGEELNYFFMLPKIDTKFSDAVKFKDEYVNLLKILSEPDVLKASLFLYSIPRKPFTKNLFEREFKLSAEESQSIIDKLQSINLIERVTVELDNEAKQGYKFIYNLTFVGLVVLIEELITESPNRYYSIEDGDTALL